MLSEVGSLHTEILRFRIVLDELSTLADYLGNACKGIFHRIDVR